MDEGGRKVEEVMGFSVGGCGMEVYSQMILFLPRERM